MACWSAFHNANRIGAGVQVSFFEPVYDPAFTVADMKAGDELILMTPNGTRSSGKVVSTREDDILIKDDSDTVWVLTQTSAAEMEKATIYSDMLNTIWTVRHRRLS